MTGRTAILPCMTSPSSNLPQPTDALARVIQRGAADFALPYDLVLAICRKESGLNTWATRYEPDFRWLWDNRLLRAYNCRPADMSLDKAPSDFSGLPGITPNTEWVAQQTSYGLMQVMGSLAREQGFKGYLSALCDPLAGVNSGCAYLRALSRKHFASLGWDGVIAAYNAGSPRKDGVRYINQEYVDGVRALGFRQ
ncbi:lytic transglycosylase domain-containing protein [Stagnimonas aquatica]|nr:lytic transglycosylase domain-containing protein [Stagnimonas aquatica]